MKKLILLFVSVIMLLSLSQTYAQKGKKSTPKKGHELIFHIKDSPDNLLYLVIHYNDKLIIKDSLPPVSPGLFIFKGDNVYDDGMYSLVSESKKLYLNFIIDNNQFFEYYLDTTTNVDNFYTKNSPENEEMLKFQRKTTQAQKKAAAWGAKIKEFKDLGKTDSADFYQQKLVDLNDEMMTFINDEIIAAHPDYLFSKMQKSYRNIDVPEFKTETGEIDREAQNYYFKNHYWDNVDLADHRFIYIPSFEPKLKEYFLKYLYHTESDTINKYIDLFLAKTEADTLMFHYCVDWLSYNFETSKIIGHDAVFYHIAKNNQLAGKCYWLDQDILSKYEKRVKRIEPILVGKIAPELIIPDTNMSENPRDWKSSYHSNKPYTILWFYDPTCPTCKKEAKNLRLVYDSLENIGKRNFDVYAIGDNPDLKVWKKYVKENNYPWTNVGGNKGNMDYLEYFGIYETGNPAMFVVNNRTHEIILNKRIDMFMLPQFFEEYERIQQRKLEEGNN
ncbi:MAG: DUF5106 domain-containing protein [Bacteroidales bacterium]|nr:DUF5106 domain-containing protein [Bacteroidales bacterium]